MTRSALALALVSAGCLSPQSSPPAPDLAPPRVISAPPPVKPPRPTATEVQISGKIVRPRGVKGAVKVWAASGPCFTATSSAYGETLTNRDRWSVTAFVPEGSPLWLCAAVVDGKDAWKVWGQANHAPVIGTGTGEVILGEQTIPLKRGTPVSAPASHGR